MWVDTGSFQKSLRSSFALQTRGGHRHRGQPARPVRRARARAPMRGGERARSRAGRARASRSRASQRARRAREGEKKVRRHRREREKGCFRRVFEARPPHAGGLGADQRARGAKSRRRCRAGLGGAREWSESRRRCRAGLARAAVPARATRREARDRAAATTSWRAPKGATRGTLRSEPQVAHTTE